MAKPLFHYQSHSRPSFPYTKLRPLAIPSSAISHFPVNTNVRFQRSVKNPDPNRLHICNSSSTSRFSLPSSPTDGDRDVDLVEGLKEWMVFIRSVLPGGSWWDLCDPEEDLDATLAMAKPVTVLHALRRMWALVEDHRLAIFAAFASLTIAAFVEISIPNLLASSVFSAQNGETAAFYKTSQLMVFLCFISGICSGLRSGCFGIVNTIMLKRLRETLYTSLIFQDISFFDRETVGDMTSRLGADCQRLSHVIGYDVHLILRNFLQGTGALVSLLTLSWPLALSTLVICSVLSAIFLIYGQYQKKAAKIAQEFTACANEVTQETFSLMRTVRVQAMAGQISFYKCARSSCFWVLESEFQRALSFYTGGMSILTGHASAEQLTKYVLYCEWLIYATWRIGGNMSSLFQSIGASEKVFQLMNLVPSNQFLLKGVKLQRLTGNIEFLDVSFYYPSRIEVPTLAHVNMSIKANEVVAIIGPSGSGKSTLVNLLLRLYEPTHGQILVDGIPTEELDIRWLRENIGYVGQEPHLFHMDIKSNICYGCPGDIKQEDIEWAAKEANAHEFISSLPNSYETVVDDALLSGGQKQRIAIARAILRDPAILILDEATSALDAEMLHAFRSNGKAKRTVIIIAHRLSTIKSADRLVVMEDGRIVEMGDHQRLLHESGLYRRLVGMQM
ncbi:hypothetical protein RJ640_028001, partial [Escallonia rubra]